jgi:hypothetical protein
MRVMKWKGVDGKVCVLFYPSVWRDCGKSRKISPLSGSRSEPGTPKRISVDE